MKKILFVCIAIAAASAAARAQPGPPEWGREPPPPPPLTGDGKIAPRDSANLSKERRMLEAVRISRLTEAVGLNEEQIEKFIPRLKRMEEQQRQLGEKHRQALEDIALLLESGAKDDQLKARLDELDRADAEKFNALRTGRNDLDALLTVGQRARWRVFNERFDREIRHMVRQLRERRMRCPAPDGD